MIKIETYRRWISRVELIRFEYRMTNVLFHIININYYILLPFLFHNIISDLLADFVDELLQRSHTWFSTVVLYDVVLNFLGYSKLINTVLKTSILYGLWKKITIHNVLLLVMSVT
jgi:hypothetical protein